MIDLPVAILAGGLATRLRPITATIPKSLVSVAGRPFLAHQLEYLRGQGISRVVMCVGYLGEMICKQFGDGSALGIKIEYSFDGPVLLGTGGAISRALPLLGDTFFVLYGDSYLPINFQSVLSRYREAGRPALMTIFPNFGKWEISNVWFDKGEIRKYSKRDRMPEMQYVDYGLSVFRADVFRHMSPGAAYDLADVMSTLSEQGQMTGYVAQERFYEIGSITGLEELNHHLGGSK